MEHGSVEILHDKNDGTVKNELAEKANPKQQLSSRTNIVQAETAGSRGGENVAEGTDREDVDVSGELNMEASVTADDVMRAGGFGARDDISSFLPVASDSTDFEASLCDARDYEDPQEETCSPGLGWSEVRK